MMLSKSKEFLWLSQYQFNICSNSRENKSQPYFPPTPKFRSKKKVGSLIIGMFSSMKFFWNNLWMLILFSNFSLEFSSPTDL